LPSPAAETNDGEHIFDDFEVTELSGGITNKLYRVRHVPTDASVVARVFGKETDRIISRDSELFYQSLFIPTYGKGRNILVYKFLAGYRPLDFTELADYSSLIAIALAEFHVTATEAALNDRSLVAGLSSCSDSSSGCRSGDTKNRLECEVNHLDYTLGQWVDSALEPATIAKILQSASKSSASGPLFHMDAKEAASALLAFQSANFANSSPIGIAHNDLLSGNIMVVTVPSGSTAAPGGSSSTSVGSGGSQSVCCLIDFEYARKNFLLFDLGNHLNEFAGTECDYAKTFPSAGHIAEFVASYRRSMRAVLKAKCKGNSNAEDLVVSNEENDVCSRTKAVALAVKLFGPGGADFFPSSCSDDTTAEDKDKSDGEERRLVDAWTRQVLFYAVCSNLGWGVWSLLQAAHSEIDFDFFAYAKARYGRYQETVVAFVHN
jgi:ethanolamine kinase